MPIRFAVLCILQIVLSTGASAQNVNNLLNMFGGMVQQGMILAAQTEWRKLPPNELSCLDQTLRQQGSSVDVVLSRGVLPNDPRLTQMRSNCRAVSTNSNIIDIQKLSSKPTFDCGRARSLTARIVCIDQSGASADWDLISAYWAQYFSLEPSDRKAFDDAQQTWIDYLNQSCPRTQNPRDCVLSAYHNRAAGYRSQLKGDALVESRLTPEQRAKIQQTLVTLGFLNDNPDGEFGTNTRAAIGQFKVQSGEAQGVFLTAQQLTELLEGRSTLTAPQPAGSNSPSCRVADPTGTPLNVRTAPNGGEIVDTLTNGKQVRLGRTQTDSRGHGWSEIERLGNNHILGWVFRDYVDCTSDEQVQRRTADMERARRTADDESQRKTADLEAAERDADESAKKAAEAETASASPTRNRSANLPKWKPTNGQVRIERMRQRQLLTSRLC